jgi:PKD repeat protein
LILSFLRQSKNKEEVMSKNKLWLALTIVLVWGAALALAPVAAQAAPPVVKTVPWVATNILVPHDTFVGKNVTLKGTCDQQGATFQYSWDFGDGTPVATGTVTDKYVIEAKHTYTGAVGTIYTARLTVTNTTSGETGSKEYYVAMREKTLQVESNVAIDEGLWALHKAQTRYTESGIEYGDWRNWSSWYGAYAANLNAFFVNGHLEGSDVANPYTETVKRGMRRLFTCLNTVSISPQTNPLGSFNPDTNGNGVGILDTQSRPYYQGGMFIDAIVASGTPDAVATTGPAGVNGKTYKTIVQDMVDAYLYAQWDSNPQGGGWRYRANEAPDNSACQWAAIGLIAAERNWGCTVPQIVKDWNMKWLTYSQHRTSYYFGYTDENPIWGPYATTPSGLVQMVMDGKGRGYFNPLDTYGRPNWDKAETFLRNNFDNTGNYTNNIKAYYYGLFSFVKSMLLHLPEPIKYLKSPTKPDIDWYAAELSKGDTSNGVARTLVTDQRADGVWWDHDPDGSMFPFETAWAIIMLNRTLFEAGAPVAVAKAIPNPAVSGQIIALDGSGSFHQDPTKSIDTWEWDFDNDGTFDASGPVVTHTFPTAVGDYPVKLRVSDNGSPEKFAETTLTVRITTPPIAPTSNAGGPYVFCPQAQPWFLDGSGSVNPDDGKSEPGKPGDHIQKFEWDLDGDGQFDDAVGMAPDVTAYFTAKGPGKYLVGLRVTDTTAVSFPSSGMGDLSDVSYAEVHVYALTAPECECIKTLAARPKLTKVQLTWNPYAGAASYNVYRGTTSGGPYVLIANTTSTYCTYLDTFGLVVGQTYYYVVRPVLPNSNELCQSNQARATISTR